jgi:hypothetical protein
MRPSNLDKKTKQGADLPVPGRRSMSWQKFFGQYVVHKTFTLAGAKTPGRYGSKERKKDCYIVLK